MSADQPAYVGMAEWMAQWWLDRLDTPPLVIIRCGTAEPGVGRRCRNAIGEVKRDGDRVLAMSRNEHPEIEIAWIPLAAPTVEDLAAELAERDDQALRYVGTGPGHGSVVYKRTVGPGEVAPVEMLSYYVCRDHGEIEANPQALAAFVEDTHAPKRTYWARPDVS